MKYQLVIFDFDGTLADSMGWMRDVMEEVAEHYNFRQVSPAEIERLRGQDNRSIIRHLGVPFWKLPIIANHMRHLAARDVDRLKLFDGADELLRGLSARGIVLALVSSNSEENIRRVLGPENAGLFGYYECRASIFGKAAKFRRVLKRSGIPAERAIGIGDEARDIEAARISGIAAGAVTWGCATPELLRNLAPDACFDSMSDILDHLAD